MVRQSMLRQSVVFLVLAMSANGLSYVYQLAMARLLDPREYAVVLAIVSFIAILLFPGNAFQAAVAVGTGHIVQRGNDLLAWPFALRAATFGGLAGLSLVALFGIFSSGIRQIFGFEGNWVLAWLAVTFCLSLVLSAFRGALQGAQRFSVLGCVMLAEAGLRVVLAVALVAVGFGVAGATAGFAFGYVAATVLAIWLLLPNSTPKGEVRESLWATLREQLRSVPATLSIFGVQAIDVVIANSRLPDTPMESFSAAALAGRVIFYAGFVLGLLLLPRFRHVFAGGVLQPGFVAKTASVLVAITVIPVIAGFVIPGFVHNALVGPNYAPDPGLLQRYLIGTALLTTALFLTYLIIAAGWNWIAYGLLPVAVLQVALYVFVAESTYDFALILIASGAAMCAFLTIVAASLIRWRIRTQPTVQSENGPIDPPVPVAIDEFSTRDPI